jgi:hypothetical protein
LYLDDTDLLHIDLTKDETVDKVHPAIQDSVNSWGNLLIATGGALQPSKCFYAIILFKWVNGEWWYENNKIRGEFGVTIPLPQNGRALITHNPTTHVCVCFWLPVPKWGPVRHEIPISSPPLDDIPSIL